MRALFIVGRTLFGGFFVYSGVNHFQHAGALTQYAQAKGVPAAEEAVKATGALLIASGLSVMAGIKPRQGLAGIIAFLVPTTLQMHRFWEEADAQKRQTESVNFSKNVALIGAALTAMQIEEPWPVSLDAASEDNEEMFIHLGGRELRSLPA
jgi:uncharacterized membrane protein YphA (DoxX/SURF4 family)